jgi:hypothetical protein
MWQPCNVCALSATTLISVMIPCIIVYDQGEGSMCGLSVLITNLENIFGNYECRWGFK